MVDQNWDVILIGAGQNNFALGAYLGRAGLKTVVCESRLENGGRLSTEELLRPGYWNNTLWYFVDNVEHNPIWQELDFTGEHHATFIEPPVVSTLLLPDGRSVSHYQSLKDTIASIAKFSARDAAAWGAAYERYHSLIVEYLIPSYLRPAGEGGRLRKVLDANPAGADFERLSALTPRQVVDELFEDDAVKTLVLSQMAIPRGVGIDYAGAGVEVLKLIAGEERPKLTRGGIHEIAQVLQRAYVHNGGQIRAMHHVESIIVENGRAVGVRLRDGREWRARLAVVSNVDPHTTFVDMVGADKLPKAFVEKVKAIEYDEYSWFQVHLMLKSRVRYALHEVQDPSIAQALNVNIGPQRPSDLEAMWQEIRARRISDASLLPYLLSDGARSAPGAGRKAQRDAPDASALSSQGQTARRLDQAEERLHGEGHRGVAQICDELDRADDPGSLRARPVVPLGEVGQLAQRVDLCGTQDSEPNGGEPPDPGARRLSDSDPGPLPGRRRDASRQCGDVGLRPQCVADHETRLAAGAERARRSSRPLRRRPWLSDMTSMTGSSSAPATTE